MFSVFLHRLLIWTFICLGFSSKLYASNETQRIVTLSPHLAEIVFELDKSDALVAVSAYSDYPKSLLNLPQVAGYQGADIAEIVRLAPTHVLVWQGGNKSADIAKLESLGLNVYQSSILTIDNLFSEINQIGKFIEAKDKARALTSKLKKALAGVDTPSSPVSAVYYLNTSPLVGLGSDPWLNSLLSTCNIQNLFQESSSPYPQLSLSEILRRQPQLLLAADGRDKAFHQSFWSDHASYLKSSIIILNPDEMHRFTPRAVYATINLCASIIDQGQYKNEN
ncbi:helical backbone metal receptor [Glaciecola sp. 1036]|uniref:helical backbone metal receptor n=1 Tax=Alteromonadaceae TaxID=72275 RepID=UPI003D074B67